MDTVNVILNGKSVTGNAGESILQLASRHGIEIPTLCNDPRLEPYSSCYVCVVEIEGMKALQPSCSTKIAEGMKINTENDNVRNARKAAIDLIVSNHYADCAAPCKMTCPAGVDVQGYISLIEKGLYSEAIGLIKKVNPLPAICGRICVRPCEVACRRNLLDEVYGVGIDYLKRFAADQDLASAAKYKPDVKPSTGKKVAVIGAGPGGLSAAWFIQQEGHQCDIYEAAPAAGGWLRYGIPQYRLPNEIIDKEVASITELGVNIFYNKKLGENLSYKELKEKYQAVILAIGSQIGTSIGCEGDDAGNIFSGIDFLKQMEVTGERYDFRGKTIAVIGGGNTAMDCCRTSIRCHAQKVYVIYRRTEKEMPANPIEIHESKLEGVEYMFLTAPKKVNKDANGNIESLTCLKMELGEPDASGRRRPVVVEGSEFDVKLDYVLAAIGQKTNVNFLDDVRQFATGGELKANKWGDIECDKNTLQTGLPGMFAAGDGVTGPATAIEAIAQARRAAVSCHQYLTGQPMVPEKSEFISKRDNFKQQVKEEYVGHYEKLMRHEMPTIDPGNRINFNEVELGYENENVAVEETGRCLECGCVRYFDCDLKKIATDYNAEQGRYSGEYKQYKVKFDHPFIEIDNNKCVLCARCVRICSEVVGANALGLVNRGYETYVAPALGNKLQDTTCESCGMCISACPTAAMSENFKFKPGPVRTEVVESVCHYCSVGCKVQYHVKGGHIWQVAGAGGQVNADGNICRFPKFGYVAMNDKDRITKPMVKENGGYKEISFDEAYQLITSKLSSGKSAFFAGARLTNEEMFLVNALSEKVKDSVTGSFHYMGRHKGYGENILYNVPFEQLNQASHIWLLASEINKENAVAGFMIHNNKFQRNIPVTLITRLDKSAMEKKCDEVIRVKSNYYFIKAASHYILSNNLQNELFLKKVKGYEAYRTQLLKESYASLCEQAGCTADIIKNFAETYNNAMNGVLVAAEKNHCAFCATEIRNLAMITGKLGKTASGIIELKEKNNSEGISNSGLMSKTADNSPDEWNGIMAAVKNLYVFGEDPLGCAIDKKQAEDWFKNKDFVVVQDYCMTETAARADLILPASYAPETGGSFTNTQRIIQTFDKVMDGPVVQNSLQQLLAILRTQGVNGMNDATDVHSRMLKSVTQNAKSSGEMELTYTEHNKSQKLFDYGCDSETMRTTLYFDHALKS
jgi:formate dehydrogenase major subunit